MAAQTTDLRSVILILTRECHSGCKRNMKEVGGILDIVFGSGSKKVKGEEFEFL